MAPKTFGSIRELPSGNFQARYRPNSGPALVVTLATRADAEGFLEKLRQLVEDGQVIDASDLAALAER